jgi:hypothetical protein
MAITATERFEIEKLLVLMFNAAPGADYLAQVVGLYEATGHNLQTVANALDDIPAFQSLHPNFQTAAEFAADFLTPLGLQNDTLAKSFVMDKFNAGVPKGEIMYEGLQALNSIGAGASAQYVTAKAILENKATVSEYYSVTKGISQTDIALLQTVLNGVTSDAATVTTAEHNIDNGTVGSPGVTLTLSPTQDTLLGTNAADIINGLFGGTDATYTAGDSIDGANGTDTLNLVATGTTASAAVIVKNVEAINIQDTVGATFNALLVENNAGITFTNTVAGQTSTVTNGALGSTMGLAGKGNLVVDYATTSGTTDTANVSLNGVGTSSKVVSTVDVGDTNTVEAVKIATHGTNFVNLLAGTAAGTVTVTGDGTNTFTFGSIKATSTIDASASTGTNTFDLGTGGLSNGDVIKGGTGADTVKFTATSALGIVTLSGVETLSGTVNADLSLNLGTSTGLKTLTLAGGTGSLDVTNAPAELTTVNYQSTFASSGSSGIDTDNDFSLAYKTGTVGNITVNLGTATATNPLTLDELSFTRAESLTFNALGTKAIAVNGAVTIDDTTKSLAFNVGDSGDLSFNSGSGISTGSHGSSALSSVTATVGADASFYSYWIDASGAENVAVNVTAGASGTATIDYIYANSFADVNVNIGAHGSGYEGIYASAGDIGNVTLTAGSGADVQVDSYASAGDIGNISMTLASGASGTASGYAYSGDVGNVSMTVGSDASGYVYIEASGTSGGVSGDPWSNGGNVGDVNITVNGASGHASGYIYAYAAYSGSSGAGGNIGNVTVDVAGSGSDADLYLYSSGGNQGDFAITVGASGSAYITSYAYEEDSSGDFGNVGNINAGLADGSYFSGYWDASGSVGNTNVEAGDNVSAYVDAYGYSGSVGAVSVAMGDSAYFSGWFSAGSGDQGGATITVGEDSYVDIGTEGANVAATSVTAGAGSEVYAYQYFSGGTSDGITIAGGDAGNYASAYASGGSITQIDLHGWLGTYSIDASDVSGGTIIMGGADGGSIYATAGADVITGGAGNDFISAGGGADVVTAGAGDDSIQGGAGADVINAGAGNDTIDGGTGADDMTGGAGNDLYFVDNAADLVHEDANGGTDTVISFVANWTNGTLGFTNIENVIFNANGTTGADSINGGAGADTFFGDAGNDTINGGAGNDTINGGAGNDVIDGNGGVDSMTGGADADTFVFTGTGDVLATPVAIASLTTTDIITDFVSATDKLDFATAGSGTNYAENTTAAASMAALLAAADTALDGTVQYYFGVVGTDGYLIHSTNGSTADAMVKLAGVTDIAATDIV